MILPVFHTRGGVAIVAGCEELLNPDHSSTFSVIPNGMVVSMG